jgi:hypothetical protein
MPLRRDALGLELVVGSAGSDAQQGEHVCSKPPEGVVEPIQDGLLHGLAQLHLARMHFTDGFCVLPHKVVGRVRADSSRLLSYL